MNRIYVCHTYYHVYVSILKELNFQKKNCERGTIALSLMSTNFKNLKSRLESSNIFSEVIELNEVHPRFFNQKFKYEIGKGNWIFKFYTRMLYWKYIAVKEEEFINVVFSIYSDIYVYCDGDPIGQYLNYKKIHYHAVEDGLDSCKYGATENANSNFFILKLMLTKLGVLFIQDGYAKYAIDLEVNNKIGLKTFGRKVVEIPRKKLLDTLTIDEKQKIYDVFFVGTTDKVFINKKNIMLLTQGVCTIEQRIKMYKDIIRDYCDGYNVYIKPHPIDNVDYKKEFPECIVLEQFFPIEIFNFKCELDIDKIISVYSASLDSLTFAEEKINLGVSLLDNYEERNLHEHLLGSIK